MKNEFFSDQINCELYPLLYAYKPLMTMYNIFMFN